MGCNHLFKMGINPTNVVGGYTNPIQGFEMVNMTKSFMWS